MLGKFLWTTVSFVWRKIIDDISKNKQVSDLSSPLEAAIDKRFKVLGYSRNF